MTVPKCLRARDRILLAGFSGAPSCHVVRQCARVLGIWENSLVLELTPDQQLVVHTVREFVEREVIPVASEMEHGNEYPHALVETMKQLGLFGLNIPEEYGGDPVDYTTFALIFEELSRGWMSL